MYKAQHKNKDGARKDLLLILSTKITTSIYKLGRLRLSVNHFLSLTPSHHYIRPLYSGPTLYAWSSETTYTWHACGTRHAWPNPQDSLGVVEDVQDAWLGWSGVESRRYDRW